MKIAVASSGLGHVARGIETWARDTACALAQAGVDVTLFCAGQVNASARTVVLPSLRRGDAAAGRAAVYSPGWAWRWQLKSDYGWEQLSFWRHLWPHLRRGKFDILHVQDPMLAYWCRAFRKWGWVETKEILAHGTEESAEFLHKFDYVQHLAPWHEQQVAASREQGAGSKEEAGGATIRVHAPCSLLKPYWAAIPNFVDTEVFRPASSFGERAAARAAFGLPPGAFVVGAVAAVKRHHKRVDYLIGEFARYLASEAAAVPSERSPMLVIAGARTTETDELIELARQAAPERIRVFCDLPRERMPDFYRALDVCVLPSLFEMMPIAVLEALASGVPVLANRHPVLQWMIGADDETAGGDGESGGCGIDMAAPGALARCLRTVSPEWTRQRGAQARRRAESVFSRPVVVSQYIAYYRRILEERTEGSA